MPLDISITNIDSTVSWFNIPLRIMRGVKGVDMIGDNVAIKSDWPWVYNFYEFEVDVPKEEILKIEIDASTRLADVFRENNIWMKDSLVKKTPEIIYRSKL
jgi:hypothetical protein